MEVGNSIIDEINEFKVMKINSTDVIDKKIVGGWKERELNKKMNE